MGDFLLLIMKDDVFFKADRLILEFNIIIWIQDIINQFTNEYNSI